MQSVHNLSLLSEMDTFLTGCYYFKRALDLTEKIGSVMRNL